MIKIRLGSSCTLCLTLIVVSCIKNSHFFIKTVTTIVMQNMITTAATEVSDAMIADIILWDRIDLMWMYRIAGKFGGN